MPTFYLANPPEPEDLFTVLIDLQKRPTPTPNLFHTFAMETAREDSGQVWYPTGLSAALSMHVSNPALVFANEDYSLKNAAPARAADSDDRLKWLRVSLELDWEAGNAVATVEPLFKGEQGLPPQPSRARVPFLAPSIENGFRFMYLFVWAEGGMLPPSEVHISDLWLED
mmetsp:Transcript_49409/g.113176  ORF Transcript_49409/g.113176 Transcript_49409/m.113176 type:complete len:170 (+) Transcript_49409:25-534(+)